LTFAFKINDKARVELADKVYVLGTPADITLGQTISSGIISAQRNFFGRDYYQTDARLNGGNSGGALMNESGELIGVVCSKISGLGIEGVGFVIPAKYIFERLKIDVN
jgi:serine protease Do